MSFSTQQPAPRAAARPCDPPNLRKIHQPPSPCSRGPRGLPFTPNSQGDPEELRLLYALEDPTLAPAHLDAWLAWASRSKLDAFVKLAGTIRRHRDGILAAIRLALTNGRLEGLNSRIRLISHRSFGFHSAPPLIALIYLCCSGINIPLPQ